MFNRVFTIKRGHVNSLVRRAKKGDKEAFGKIYDQFVNRIYRFVLIRVNSNAEAEDLTQIIFTKALEHIHSYKQKGLPFAAWLFRIARNTVIDYYRRKGRHFHQSLETIVELSVPDKALSNLGKKERNKTIRQAIRKLPDKYQETITLRFIEEMSYKEIGKVISKSDGAVRIMAHRAIKQLKKELDGKI